MRRCKVSVLSSDSAWSSAVISDVEAALTDIKVLQHPVQLIMRAGLTDSVGVALRIFCSSHEVEATCTYQTMHHRAYHMPILAAHVHLAIHDETGHFLPRIAALHSRLGGCRDVLHFDGLDPATFRCKVRR